MSENIKFVCTGFRNMQKNESKTSFTGLLSSQCKLILYLSTLYVYCVDPAMSKSQKQLPNCLKIAETRVVLIVLNYVLYRVHAYIVTVSCRRST
jgi:hypothetical protein